MYKLFGVVICLMFSFSSYSQANITIEVLDYHDNPYQFMELGITQLELVQTTDQKGICIFKAVPPGVYALSLDYNYDIEYRTLSVQERDTSIRIYLERRIEFEEILIKAQELDLSRHSNSSVINETALQKSNSVKDIPFILESVPGLWAQSDAGNGVGYSGIRLRGLSPGHIHVNLNGIPYNDAESSLSYFVDIPDITSSAESIKIFRGNVPSRAGAPSFGAAIDIQTNKLQFEPSAVLNSAASTYGGLKFGALLNSGLIANAYHIEFGYSKQLSDGYIERSSSNLKSFRFSAGIVKPKYSIRLNYFSGSELTGQAWYGLPAQYLEIDSLRRFNLAGTSKPGAPYTDETDQYTQDHIQLFFQRKLSDKLNMSWASNYTSGKGFYKNYQASVSLESYGISSPDTITGDLTRRKWLDNDFFFTNLAFAFSVNPKFILRPIISYSHYNGDHFGDVDEVFLDNYKVSKFKYYFNTGIKNEFSAAVKAEFIPDAKWVIGSDFHYRNIDYSINGNEEFKDSLNRNFQYSFFSPKIFANYKWNKNIQLSSSIGYMQREPFRADLLASNGLIPHEQLFDIELGWKYILLNKIMINLNAYYMHYPSLNALSGEIDDVGEALRVNLSEVKNTGLEWELQLKLFKSVRLSHSGSRSWTVIPEWQEVINSYGPAWEILPAQRVLHTNSPLSYSPEWVSRTTLNYAVIEGQKTIKDLSLNISHQTVSDFYLDNTSRPGSRHNGYSVQDLGLNLNLSLFGINEIYLWFKIHNLLNTKYSSHGWISRFSHQGNVDLMSDPYLIKEENQQYAYKAYFPQATRHFSMGIRLNFR